MVGSAGNDTYIVDLTGDAIIENPNEGIDVALSSATYILSANVENLVLTGSASINGTGNALANTITGNSGNNIVDGLAGADTMAGGAGDDTYKVDESGDIVVESANSGNDTVVSPITYALPDNVENLTVTGFGNLNATGNDLGNVLTGNDAAFAGEGKNTLIGGGGDDVLDGRTGFDTLQGGSGDDTYIINDSMGGPTSLTLRSEPGDWVGGGQVYWFNTDTGNFLVFPSDRNQDSRVDYLSFSYRDVDFPFGHWFSLDFSTTQLGTNFEPGTYLNAQRAAFASPGHAGLDVSGDGRGSNQVFGSFTVDAVNFDYSGSSPVLESFSIRFEQHSENPAAPALFGTLNYHYPPAGPSLKDLVIENPGEGIDTVTSSVGYTLPANVEKLVLTGNANVDGAGNDLDNTISGNSAANDLFGGGGNDSLSGGAGRDTLDGGPGTDALRGGAGGDSYFLNDSAADAVIENPGEGTDTVVSQASCTLAANVENLTLTGVADSNGTGNELNNVIIGNSGNNSLAGGAGNDILLGGTGNDVLDGGADGDILRGGTGDDTYIINDVASLHGLTSLVLDSEPGDWVGGGQSYTFDTHSGTFTSVLFDQNHDGVDFVRFSYRDAAFPFEGHWFNLDFSTTQLGANIVPGTYVNAQRASFAAPGHPGIDVSGDGRGSNQVFGSFTVLLADFDYSGPSPVLRNLSISFEQHSENPGAPALFGTLTYSGASESALLPDDVLEVAGEGSDTLISSLTYTLPANVENLTLTGSSNIDGTGNALANAIIGNAGNNTLSGGGGNDTYILNVGFGHDLIIDQDATSGNVDTIRFGSGITPENLAVEDFGNDVRLSPFGGADIVLLQEWLASDANKIERVEFANGVVWGVPNILGRIRLHTQSNHAPALDIPLMDQVATEDTAFSFTVPVDAFSDVDAGDILSFTATRADGLALPGWLAFDAATRTFSGMPATADAGTLRVRVTATDTANASAVDEFQLTVTGDEDDHNHDKRRKGNEGVGNGEDPPPPGHDHNQNDGPGTGPGNPGSRQQTNDRDRGRVRTADRDSYGSNSDSAHRDESIGELVHAYLARKPDYDFEALARELERPQRREEVLNPLEIARRWAQMHRYIDALGEADDEEARYGALIARRGFFGQAGGRRGRRNLWPCRVDRRSARHREPKMLQGLEEGFTRLRT